MALNDKNVLIALLVVAVVFAAGCVNSDKGSITSPGNTIKANCSKNPSESEMDYCIRLSLRSYFGEESPEDKDRVATECEKIYQSMPLDWKTYLQRLYESCLQNPTIRTSACSIDAGTSYLSKSKMDVSTGELRIALGNGRNHVNATAAYTSKDTAANTIITSTETGVAEDITTIELNTRYWLYIADATDHPTSAGDLYSVKIYLPYSDEAGSHVMTADCRIVSE